MILTFDSLREFDTSNYDQPIPFRDLGLNLSPNQEFLRCEFTPRNSSIFAGTGGDSVHYCVLRVPNLAQEDSPIVMVVPCNSEKPLFVLAESLREFLALGMDIGFFFLEQLTYEYAETLKYLHDRDAFISYCYYEGSPSKKELEELKVGWGLLDTMRYSFELESSSNLDSRFQYLQNEWLDRLWWKSDGNSV